MAGDGSVEEGEGWASSKLAGEARAELDEASGAHFSSCLQTQLLKDLGGIFLYVVGDDVGGHLVSLYTFFLTLRS